MCDKCGDIFSERTDGWSTFVGTKNGRDDRGRPTTTSEQMDMCAACSMPGAITPRLAVGSATGVDRIAQTQTQADRDRILNGDATDAEPPY